MRHAARRSAMLAPLLRLLAAHPYPHLHKEISFEVATVHSDIVDFRARRVEERQRPESNKKPRP